MYKLELDKDNLLGLIEELDVDVSGMCVSSAVNIGTLLGGKVVTLVVQYECELDDFEGVPEEHKCVWEVV